MRNYGKSSHETIEKVNKIIAMLSDYDEDPIDQMVFDLVYELRKVREKKGVSQIQLAQKANMSQTAISQFETLSKKPSVHTLFRIIRALDCRLELDTRTDCSER